MDGRDYIPDATYKSLQAKLTAHFKEFDRIWESYGYPRERISQRKRTIEKHFDDLFSDMIGEENKRLNEKREELNDIIIETRQLVKDLELIPKDDPMKTRLENSPGMTLLEEEAVLFEIVQDLRKRKEIRMERYNDINSKMENLCTVLGETPFVINFEGIPTDPQVEELNRHYHTLQQEERIRLDKYHKFVSKIKDHFINLEKFPSNQLERIIITGQPTDIPAPLSASVMKEIGDLESTLHKQIDHNRVEAETLWQKIKDLWKRLKTDEEICNAFERAHPWTQPDIQSNKRKSRAVVLIAKPTILTGLQKELARLEEEKKENISSFIKELRAELIVLWETCYAGNSYQYTMSDCMGQHFTQLDFSSDVYSEELLDKHEKEVETWRLYVEEQKKLIEGVGKRKEMWIKWLELDLKSDDPARFANRGGALLREEKERKTLEKQIPKLEKELTKCSEKHMEKYGVKFTVFGEEISMKIERDWEDFHSEKEARKNARKIDGGKSFMMTTTTGPPGSRKRPAPQTPQTASSSVKKRGRVLMATPKSPFLPRVPPSSSRLGPTPSSSMQLYPIASSTAISGSSVLQVNFKRPAPTKRPIKSKPAGMPTSKPAVKQHPGVAVLRKYRKSIGRNRLTIKKAPNIDDSDKTLSCGSLASRSDSNSNRSFSPLLGIDTEDQLNFAKTAEKLSGSENSGSRTDLGNLFFQQLSVQPTRFLTPTPRGPARTIASASGKKPGRKSLRLQNKEQLPTTKATPGKAAVVSPASTYSEFSKDLLGQSTLNSSVTAAVLAASREPLSNLGGSTTPNRIRNAQPRMTPAKAAVPFNNKF